MNIMRIANGFKIREGKEDGTSRSLIIEELSDGEKITENEFRINFPEEEEKLIAKYMADMMYNLDVERDVTQQERERLAKKIMPLNIINGYKIIRNDINSKEDENYITVELLKNGREYASTEKKIVTDDELKELADRLNGYMRQNLDVRHEVRPLWFAEILLLINK